MRRPLSIVAIPLGACLGAASFPAIACDADHQGLLSPPAETKHIVGSPGPTTPPPAIFRVFIDGRLIALSQFIVGGLLECPTLHWHALNGISVTALDGTVIPDPDPDECGYGVFDMVAVFEVFDIPVPDSDFDGLPDVIDGVVFDASPGDPDADDNGIPDGNEDFDGDGLNSGQEFWLSRTNPGVADSDGNGYNDAIDYAIATTARDFTKIPLVVNLYQGSGANATHIEQAVAQANIVLAKAKLMFLIVKTNPNATAGDDGSGGGTAGDGSFTRNESARVTRAGRNEVAALPGMKGFKVSFAQNGGVVAGTTTPGISIHRRASVVCTQRPSTALTGATIAHELFHVLTLDDSRIGTPEGTPGNIMTQADRGRDGFVNSPDADKGIANVTLTPRQLAQITKDGMVPQVGVTSTRNSPAHKRQYESGIVVDAPDDRTAGQPDYLEIEEIQASSDETEDTVHVLISLGGRFPASDPYLAVYRVLFDTDDNPTTGSQGAVGFELETQVTINVDSVGPHAILRRYGAGASRIPVFPAPLVYPMTLRAGDSTFIESIPSDVIELRIPKSVLGMTADEVPVRVLARATELGSNVDTADFIYDRKRWEKDPTMTLTQESAGAGQSVSFSVSGLTPNATFAFRIGDTVLFNAMLDATGAYTGAFTAPATTTTPLRFLSAQDATGLFAFSGILVQDGVFANGFEGP